MAHESYHISEDNEMADGSFPQDVDALVAAMAAVLRDAGQDGRQTVSFATKAQARVAYEPFADDADRAAMMPLKEARTILWMDI